MVRAAVADQPSFVVDDREVRRSGVSYSVDTLTELRREYPRRSLCLLLGMDAFLGLPNWHRWRESFSTLAHIIVCSTAPAGVRTRPPEPARARSWSTTAPAAIRDLHEQRAGRVYVHAP